jgi:hypothetical protein
LDEPGGNIVIYSNIEGEIIDSCENQGLITCPADGSCVDNAEDCSCPEAMVADCSGDGDCCFETWISDGYEDCEDQVYGCDLTCYDCDGGDCPDSDCSTCEDDGEFTCWDGSCAETEDDCPLNCEEQGGTDCWDGSCAVGEDCPEQPECGDGVCNGDEDEASCLEDCPASTGGGWGITCDSGYINDCADYDCCPESWIGDGFADCEDQAYGCDLTCYGNDGGDCDRTQNGKSRYVKLIKKEIDKREGKKIPSYFSHDNIRDDCGGYGPDVDECGVCFGDASSCSQDLDLGDVNGDGQINVIDIVMIVELILIDNYDIIGDVNEDGLLNVIDVVMLVNQILNP